MKVMIAKELMTGDVSPVAMFYLNCVSVAANTTPERADSTQKGTMILRGNTEGIGSLGAKMANSHIPAISNV